MMGFFSAETQATFSCDLGVDFPFYYDMCTLKFYQRILVATTYVRRTEWGPPSGSARGELELVVCHTTTIVHIREACVYWRPRAVVWSRG